MPCLSRNLGVPWDPWVPTFHALLNAPKRGAFLGVNAFPHRFIGLWRCEVCDGHVWLCEACVSYMRWEEADSNTVKMSWNIWNYPKIHLYIGEQDISKHHLSVLATVSRTSTIWNSNRCTIPMATGSCSCFALFKVQVCAGQTNDRNGRHEIKTSIVIDLIEIQWYWRINLQEGTYESSSSSWLWGQIRCVQFACPTWSNVHCFLPAEISQCRFENLRPTEPKLNSSFRTLSAACASVHCPLYFHNPTMIDLDELSSINRLHPSFASLYFEHCSCASCA